MPVCRHERCARRPPATSAGSGSQMLIERETSEPTPSGICSSVRVAVRCHTLSGFGRRERRSASPRRRVRECRDEAPATVPGRAARRARGRRRDRRGLCGREQLGLTRSDLAAQRQRRDTRPPGGAAQLALGTLASCRAPCARTPSRSLAGGAALGALASREAARSRPAPTRWRRSSRSASLRVEAADERGGAQARERLLAAEQVHALEQARRDAAAGDRHAHEAEDDAGLERELLADAAQRRPRSRRRVHSQSASAACTAARISAARSCPATRRQASWSISTGPNRNEQSGSNSASVAIFSCASGVTSTIALGLRRQAASRAPRGRRSGAPRGRTSAARAGRRRSSTRASWRRRRPAPG